MCVCVCVCVCVRERERERERERVSETGRQAGRQAGRHRDRQRKGDACKSAESPTPPNNTAAGVRCGHSAVVLPARVTWQTDNPGSFHVFHLTARGRRD